MAKKFTLTMIIEKMGFRKHSLYIIFEIVVLMQVLGCSINTLDEQKTTAKIKVKVSKILQNDKLLNVEIILDTIIPDSAVFCFPKSVPGTYCYNYYGRNIDNFKCYDNEGNFLKYDIVDSTNYRICKSGSLHKIVYDVHPYTENSFFKENNMLCDQTVLLKDFCLMNFSSVVGYFKGFEKFSYSIELYRPQNYYSVSSLKNIKKFKDSDLFFADNYDELIDNPISYSAKLDTLSCKIGKSSFFLSIYSRNSTINTSMLKDVFINACTTMQKKYDSIYEGKYNIILFSFSDIGKHPSICALEHKNSAVIYIDEFFWKNKIRKDGLKKTVSEVFGTCLIHELFHKIVPLTVHSAELSKYNYEKPYESGNLWFYEGLAEYLSHKYMAELDSSYQDNFFLLCSSGFKYLKSMKEWKHSNLIEESKRSFQGQNSLSEFYTASLPIFLILDLQLLGKGKKLDDVINKMYNNKPVYFDDSLFEYLQNFIGNSFADHLKSNIISFSDFNISALLKNIGYTQLNGSYIVAAKQTDEYINSTVPEIQILDYSEHDNKISAQFSDGAEKYGFKAGTLCQVIKINGQAVNADLFNHYFSSFSQNKEKFSLTIFVNSIKKEIIINPNYNYYPHFSSCFVPSDQPREQDILRRKFFFN
jgi:predicted metalloprotease with PDZ domain